MKKIILILLVLITANTLCAQSGYFKRLKVDDSLYAPLRINAGSYYLNGVLITFGGSVDTSLLLHKYNGTIFNARLSDSVFRFGYNLDTTKTPKLSMNNTYSGLNDFTNKLAVDSISYSGIAKDLHITAGDSIILNSNTKLSNKTLSIEGSDKSNVSIFSNRTLSFKSGGKDTIGTTDNYALHFKTNNTSRWYIDSLGQLWSNGANVISFSPITGYFSAAGFFMGSCKFTFGSANPESSTNAWKGSLYIRSGGDIGTTGYLKETPTGSASTTGWNPIATNRSDTITTFTGTRTVTMLGTVLKCTPTQNCTFNASGGVAGNMLTFYFTTSGTTDYRVTFGTNFKSTAVIDMGSTSGKIHTVTFVCKDGTEWAEISRTMNM